MTKRHLTLFIIFLSVLGIFVYQDSLDGGFIWDDNQSIKGNRFIRSWSYLPKILSSPSGLGADIAGSDITGCYYRPLTEITYAVDYSFWGLNPRGYHQTNVMLHIVVALVLFWFTAILFKDHRIAAVASILFLVHPAHTEAVCYISGRGESLSLLFMLLSFICYIQYVNKRDIVFIVGSAVSFGLSLLSKENSIILPALLLLYHYTFRKKIPYGAFASIAAVFCIFMAVRTKILINAIAHLAVFEGLLERIPGFFVAFLQYLRLLVFPFDLHMEHGKPLFALSDGRVIIGMFCMVLVLLIAIKKKRSDQIAFFSIGWFFITLLPVSNLYPIAFFFAEHNVYFPSFGFFLIVGSVVSVMYTRFKARALVTVCVASAVMFYSFLTVQQNSYWQDPETFYIRTLSYAPRSTRVLTFLGQEYFDRGEHERAIEVYERVIQIDTRHKHAYHDLGIMLISAKRYDEAQRAFEAALAIDKNSIIAYNGVGILFATMGRFEDAKQAFEKALAMDPLYVQAYNNLAFLHSEHGYTEEAVRLYQKALEIDPDYEVARNALAYLSRRKGIK